MRFQNIELTEQTGNISYIMRKRKRSLNTTRNKNNLIVATIDFIRTRRVVKSFGKQYNIIIFLLLSDVHRCTIIITI